jgi:outer membrane protein assembly factor BamB
MFYPELTFTGAGPRRQSSRQHEAGGNRRRTAFLAALLLAVLALGAGCPNKGPRTPAKPEGPARVVPNDSAAYSAATTDPEQDKVLYLFDWGDGRADTTDLFESGDAATASHAWSATGSYPVRVRARDSKGRWGTAWSDPLDVTVDDNRPPDPPGRPTHVGIDSVGYPIAFTTSATDPDGDSVQIKYYFAEGRVSGYGQKVASGAAYTDSVVYAQNGWKVVYAVATDGRDTSDWSAPESVFIESPNVPPHAPEIRTQYTPERGIANGPAYRFYVYARDKYGDSLYYRWYFDGTDSVTSDMFPTDIDCYVEWTPTRDTHTYSVAVRVFDQTGLTNDTLAATTFRTVAEGEMIWELAGEYIASPAIGTTLWKGETWPAIICGSVDEYLYAVDAYQGFLAGAVTVYDPYDFNSSATVRPDGTRYVGNENGWFYAVGPDNEVRWQFGNGLDGMTATAALGSDGGIYCGGEDLFIHKLVDNGASATEAWSYRLSNEMTSSPAIGPDGRIYCCDDSGQVYCLNSDSTLSWKVLVGDTSGITSSPAVASDNTVYVGTEAGRLLAVKDGSVAWSYQITGPLFAISSSPVIGPDGNVYFGCDDGKLYRVDQNSHQPVAGWPITVSRTGTVSSTPLLCADDVVYITGDDSLYAFDVNDPSAPRRWAARLTVPPAAGPSPGPRRLALDNQPSAAVDEYGIIYTAATGGIFAIAGRPTGTLAASDWPMFHHDPKHTGRFGAR